MGRYLSIPILGFSAALTASIVPQAIDFVIGLLSNISPILSGTRGQLSLVMLIVMCWSVHAELTDSLVWAIVGGFALDLLSILPVGATSVALVLIAFTVNSVAAQLLRIRLLFLIAATPVATLFLAAYTLFALALLGSTYEVLAVTRHILIPTMIFNLLAVIPIYALTRYLQRRLEGGLQIAPQTLAPGSSSRMQE